MKGDKLRLKKIIESDRMNFAVSGQELIKKDVTSVLSDYFTLTEPIALNISGKKERYIEKSVSCITRFVCLCYSTRETVCQHISWKKS